MKFLWLLLSAQFLFLFFFYEDEVNVVWVVIVVGNAAVDEPLEVGQIE